MERDAISIASGLSIRRNGGSTHTLREDSEPKGSGYKPPQRVHAEDSIPPLQGETLSGERYPLDPLKVRRVRFADKMALTKPRLARSTRAWDGSRPGKFLPLC